MASTTEINGTLMKLYKGSTAIAKLKSNDMDLTFDKLITSSKDGAGWATHISGEKSGAFSFDGNFIETGGSTNITFDELMTDAIAGTELTIMMTTNVTGDTKWSGTCTIENLKLSSPHNDVVTFSGSLKLTGALTPATVA